MTVFQQNLQNQQKTDFLRIVSSYFDELPFEIANKNICVCLSGGADSVALLRSLLLLQDKHGYTVSACHFNHQIRGIESDNDELFCKQLCQNLGVKLYCGRDDVPSYASLNKMSLEEAARECRYAFFDRVNSKPNVDFCATAHNMNDDAETLLLNLVRGAGVNGASAIAPYRNNILRPFLKQKRDNIELFLALLGQDYVTDSTNDSVEYTRNYIRKVVIPNLQTINPSVVESLSRYTHSCREDREYFDDLVQKHFEDDLRLLPKAVRSRIILRKYKEYSGNILNNRMLSSIENAVFSNKRCIVPLHGVVEAIVENGTVLFSNKEECIVTGFDVQTVSMGYNSLFNGRVDVYLSETASPDGKGFCKISANASLYNANIIGDIRVRTRSVGDKILINGINKSLKKLFIDKKIPKEYRDIIPIFFDDMGIIYVPFVGISDRVFCKNGDSALNIQTVFNTIEHERWSSTYEK